MGFIVFSVSIVLRRALNASRAIKVNDKTVSLPRLSHIHRMEAIKPKQVRIYVEGERRKLFEHLVERSGLSETGIMSLLVTSALDAVRANGGQVTLPLQLSVGASASAPLILNDAPTPKARK